jgi:type I restriction enzyme M protein
VNSSTLVQKLWNYCNVLRDDGMSYGDYVEQLTYLLFLKMADERAKPPYSQKSLVPAPYAWSTLLAELRRVIADLIDKEIADRLPERIRA